LSPPSRLHSIAREGEPRASARWNPILNPERQRGAVISNTPIGSLARKPHIESPPELHPQSKGSACCHGAPSASDLVCPTRCHSVHGCCKLSSRSAFRFAVSGNYNVKYDSCARARLGVSSRGGRKPPEDSSSTTCLGTESSRYCCCIIRLLDRCSLLESGAGRRAPHRFCVRGMLPL
jgi:hypothetical protein